MLVVACFLVAALIGGAIIGLLCVKIFGGGKVNKVALKKAIDTDSAIISMERSMAELLSTCNKPTALAIQQQIGSQRFRFYVKEDNRCLLDS